jgi:cellulose synthase/poly-beta-1,6-N-acetylglucosamine synthase-like glycosyltransferase
MLDASVIIPARNASTSIPFCLDALLAQSQNIDSYEIIVVDDGSDDDTAKAAQAYGVRVYQTTPRGPASARNHGVSNARAAIVLFTDADCRPAPDWITTMLLPFRDPEVMGCKGVYRSDQKELIAQFVQAEYESKYRHMGNFTEIDFIDTYSAGFRREPFIEIGGYDESFPGASVEDQEFSFRMHKAGHKMVFVPDAVVSHQHADTVLRYFKKKFKIGYWKIKVLQRHPDKIFQDSHTPATLKMQIPVAFLLVILVITSPVTGIVPLILFSLIFTGLGFPEILQCMVKRKWLLGCAAPFFLFLRSIALGSGLIAGAAVGKMNRTGKTPPNPIDK